MAEGSGKRLWSENGRVQVWAVHGNFSKILKLVALHVLKIIKFPRWREFHCFAAPPLAFGIVIWLVETLQYCCRDTNLCWANRVTTWSAVIVGNRVVENDVFQYFGGPGLARTRVPGKIFPMHLLQDSVAGRSGKHLLG